MQRSRHTSSRGDSLRRGKLRGNAANEQQQHTAPQQQASNSPTQAPADITPTGVGSFLITTKNSHVATVRPAGVDNYSCTRQHAYAHTCIDTARASC